MTLTLCFLSRMVILRFYLTFLSHACTCHFLVFTLVGDLLLISPPTFIEPPCNKILLTGLNLTLFTAFALQRPPSKLVVPYELKRFLPARTASHRSNVETIRWRIQF